MIFSKVKARSMSIDKKKSDLLGETAIISKANIEKIKKRVGNKVYFDVVFE